MDRESLQGSVSKASHANLTPSWRQELMCRHQHWMAHTHKTTQKTFFDGVSSRPRQSKPKHRLDTANSI